jgi:uroporphyrinogen III methyltransferase/synthase
MTASGKVFLVGAGPGDPGLITVRGMEVLRTADAVVFDRLASDLLLREARKDAERIDAGKRRDEHRMTQDEINGELVRLAREGKVVCRLKGGDPFVFGRGGEEALALAEADVPWEVVPGVTSPIAAAAYAGVPVTQRGMAASFTVVTGSEDPEKPGSLIDWPALANVGGTLSFIMGWKSMPEIVSSLIANGLDRETPAALVQWGTTARQKTVTAPLHAIVDRGVEAGMGAPVVLIVGEVVGLREKLQWFDARPLFGRRVLVTRARSQASNLAAALEAHGAETVQAPAIAIVTVEDPGPLDEALGRLSSYDWVAFTSANAVRGIWERVEAAGLDARSFGASKLAAVGPTTARSLLEVGLRPDLIPDRYDAESVVEEFRARGITPARVLFPRSSIGRETLAEGLREMGAQVDEVTAYETQVPENSAQNALRAYEDGIDITTFTSSSSVMNLVSLLGGDVSPVNNTLVACIGPVTADMARANGIDVSLVAGEQSIEALVQAIVAHARAGALK